MKGNLLLFATSIVKLIAGCSSFNVDRKVVAAEISFTAAKVSSESSKRHSKFLSLIFILKCLSKASVIRKTFLEFNELYWKEKRSLHVYMYPVFNTLLSLFAKNRRIPKASKYSCNLLS